MVPDYESHKKADVTIKVFPTGKRSEVMICGSPQRPRMIEQYRLEKAPRTGPKGTKKGGHMNRKTDIIVTFIRIGYTMD